MKRSALERKPYRINKVSKQTPAKLKKKLDILFSLWIRTRDGKCAYPACNNPRLECSHFFNRSKMSVRYDPQNCVALCSPHHWGNIYIGWEYEKQSDYRDYMITWLGEDGYADLCQRAKKTRQWTAKDFEYLIDLLKTRPQDYAQEYLRFRP